jgi:hypothetical protein
MKMTIDLPDALLRDIKLRAIHEGRKLKDVVADLLRKGLDMPSPPASTGAPAYLTRDERSGLPLIQCRHPAAPNARLTPTRVADILLEQEVRWQDEAGR